MTYLGSKRKYSKYIVPIIQKAIDENKINTFIDCCCGGCNIIKNIKCKKRIAIDKDKYVIALWKKLQEKNFSFPPPPTRKDWDNAKKGLGEDWYIGLVKVFCSYFARGFGGGFDTKDRTYSGRCNTCKKDLPLISDIDFIAADYSTLLNYSNCVIYIDPPYQNTKKYDVSKDFDYNDFWNTVREISKNNIVFVSEQTAPEDFETIWTLETERLINGKHCDCVENLYVLKK